MAEEPEEVAESAPAIEEPEAQTPELVESEESPETKEESAASKPESAAPEAAKPSGEITPKAERRIKQLTAKLAEMERKLNERPVTKEPEVKRPVKPKLEEHETIESYDKALDEYVKANTEYESKAAIERDRQEREKKAAEDKRQTEQKELQKSWDKRSDATRKRNAEFETKAYVEAVQPTPTMDAFLVDSDIGPDVLDYLFKNDEEAERIRELPPLKQVRALIKLEEQVTLQIKGIKAKPGSKPPKYVSDTGAAPAEPKSAADILYG